MVVIKIIRVSKTRGRIFAQEGDRMVAICDCDAPQASTLTAALCRITEDTPTN